MPVAVWKQPDLPRGERNLFPNSIRVFTQTATTPLQRAEWYWDLQTFRHYPPRSDWVRPEFLMERDELYQQNLTAGRKVACVGFNGRVSESDGRRIKEETAVQLQKNLHQLAFSVGTWLKFLRVMCINNQVGGNTRFGECHQTTDEMFFAPGTLHKATAEDEWAISGVSCTLWKGFSRGPCVLLDGRAIIGLGMEFPSFQSRLLAWLISCFIYSKRLWFHLRSIQFSEWVSRWSEKINQTALGTSVHC